MNIRRLLIVRLGAMGDIIHTLPALATLRHAFPRAEITWLVEPKWRPLVDGNPAVDRVMALQPRNWSSLRVALRELRSSEYDLALDFQGLTKSAILAKLARPARLIGFEHSRETPASWLYNDRVSTSATHMVDQNLDLAMAAGARERILSFPLPAGHAEGLLPTRDFVLASPLAGWGAKQWPLENYSKLGAMLEREHGMALVLNGPEPLHAQHTLAHVSGIPGLIDATARAIAVVGLDSGPLHLAAALGKSGVAIHGPTDPARNGPYGGDFTVLRAPGAITSHKRAPQPDPSMRAISPEAVYQALSVVLQPVHKLS